MANKDKVENKNKTFSKNGRGSSNNRSNGGNKPTRSSQESKRSSRNFKPSEETDAAKQDRAMKRSTNNYDWYNHFPELTSTVGNLWFSNRIGEEQALKPTYSNWSWSDATSHTVPGIMSFSVVPGIGYAAMSNDPINQVADSIYAYIRHANAGHTNYDKSDLMMYLIVMDSAVNFWSYLLRIYGSYAYFNQNSKFTNTDILSCYHVDAKDILSNLAEFRAFINQVAISLARYAIPADMDLFKRHTALFQNIYKDAESDKSQLYIFTPGAYYVWNQTAEGGPRAEYRPITGANYSLDDLRTIWDNIMNPIVQDDDFGTMSGDLLKAYGQDNLYKFVMIGEDYQILPIYDRIINSQIENMQIFRLSTAAGVNDIVQDVTHNTIKWTPRSNEAKACYTYPSNLLNIHSDDPTVEDIVEATRFMTCAANSNSNELYCGTEIVSGCFVYYMNNGGVEWKDITTAISAVPNASGTFEYALVLDIMKNIALCAPFDWCPKKPMWLRSTAGQTTNNFEGYMVDYANYITIPQNTLKLIHEACVLSMLRTGLITLSNKNTK